MLTLHPILKFAPRLNFSLKVTVAKVPARDARRSRELMLGLHLAAPMSNPNQSRPMSYDPFWVIAVVVVVGLVVVVADTFLHPFGRISPRTQDRAVTNNLRVLKASADQYFTEHPGVSSVASATLVGTNSTQYIHSWYIVAKETYTPVVVQGAGISAMGVAGARTISYGP